MKRWIVAALLVASTTAAGAAQEKPAEPAAAKQAAPSTRQTPLKVQFVLSRVQGEKKISSMPYTLGVLSNGRQTNMRMGSSVPVVTTVFSSASKTDTTASIPTSSYQYREVGTNIDCTATDTGNGSYALTIAVEDSWIQPETGDKASARVARDVPVFRRFSANFAMLLRDGQTMQYASVTDPISGEVMRIDVTLTLAK
jgi:type II secretory pathway component GspD/PulD (secretin)